ncbi:hypothetical protein JCM1841_003085 [Sporobolomyces salmonicolor]
MESSYPPPLGSPPPETPASPPAAYPSPLPSTSSSFAAPPPPPSWTTPGSFYLGGSGAPPILNTRRAPPFKGRSSARSTPSQTPRSASAAPPLSSPVLMTEGVCCCCGTTLRYPRESPNYRCTLCEVVNDVPETRRNGLGAKQAPATPDSTPVSEEQLLKLAERLRPPDDDSDEAFAKRLAQLELARSKSSSADGINGVEDVDDPEDLLLAYLSSAYENLASIDASFRPTSTLSSHNPYSRPPALPSLSKLSTLYDLVKLRPLAMDLLRGQVEAVLRRPGASLLETDGAWAITLLECPVFLSDYTTEVEQRRWLVSRLLGLLSNLPNSIHHVLVQHLSSSFYSSQLLLEKVELICSFVSWRIGESMAGPQSYAEDWSVRAAARVCSLLVAANATNKRLPLSAFYVTLIDSLGEQALVNDFQAWETRNDRYALCQYPFLLSLGVKTHLLQFDGQRQMLEQAAAAYRSSLSRRQLESPLLMLNIRRQYLVPDSLQQISSNRLNLKKTLRITFDGEEGVDAGGLRKEWFLLLCRQLFDRQFGMFLHDPDSNLCWFNPASFESDDFWLVGVILGLAIYNTATLDVPLPLAAYKKLRSEPVDLVDLAQVQPALARGLQQLLDYDRDVEQTFCRTFVGTYEAWGETVEVELVEGGKEIAVTNANREDYVRRVVDFVLNTSISSQWDAFAEGFHEVCAGNAYSLFKAEELELVVRGSTEPLDVEELRSITVYEGFDPHEPAIEAFWDVFTSFTAKRQRTLLSFITASDRIPSTGVSAMRFKISCLGQDCDRLPTSHTCFDQLCLYRYGSREKMERMLVMAMEESEGFGLR